MTARTLRRLIGLLLALTLITAACGGDDDDSSADGADGSDTTGATDGEGDGDGDATDDGAVSGECETLELDAAADLSEVDLSGTTFNVGSKDFTEQIVLGQILVQALEAAGVEVTDNTNLGGTNVNREALLSGDITTYWEYNGTGWTVHLGQEDPSFDSDELSNDVCVLDLEENDIRWLGQSPFNDTYGFATSAEFPEELDLQGMADYLADNTDATVCLEEEFPNRPDGLVLFEEATEFTIPQDQISIIGDPGVIYDETAAGNCTFGEIFTTDGRIALLDLNVVEDPGVFIIYNVSLTMPDSAYQQAPEALDALVGALLAPLDDETMTDLNARVNEGETAEAVAAAYLSDQGLTAG